LKPRRNKFWMFKMVKCKHCKKENKKDAKFCADCGKPLISEKKESNLIPCKDCGKEISKNAEFCPNCGVSLKAKPDASITKGITKRKDPATAAVLGVLFGPFGYLYLRRYGLFFLWLILSAILISLSFVFAPILWIVWGVHMYQTAKEINQQLGIKDE